MSSLSLGTFVPCPTPMFGVFLNALNSHLTPHPFFFDELRLFNAVQPGVHPGLAQDCGSCGFFFIPEVVTCSVFGSSLPPVQFVLTFS